jgi:type IV secretory pathway TraG/TraD family ATPase VirD4
MLELFIHSSYGDLFDTKSFESVICIDEAIKNKEIVLFLFDSSAYKSDTEKLAKMVINDINSTFSQLPEPILSYCIFDEFASYASSNLSDTITLHRSNGLCATIGTQSVTTVGLKNPETERVAKELLACCNTYVVLPINYQEDIEIMSQTLGTKRTFEITTQLNINESQGATGLGSSKQVDEFIAHPQQIRNLVTGEGFIYRKSAGLKAIKIKINNTGY